ncbi:hypothetical protein KSP40_PGU001308 [Platanthera guangdongensis]|uniref:Uncharacterized protein n=1 Tax=Platanthera guangdongensis TaxID=2320717 RepID=A0ABR2M1P3_9ASPA
MSARKNILARMGGKGLAATKSPREESTSREVGEKTPKMKIATVVSLKPRRLSEELLEKLEKSCCLLQEMEEIVNRQQVFGGNSDLEILPTKFGEEAPTPSEGDEKV